MNRALFITIGIVTIIVVFVIWLFLFINGAPASTTDVFSDLGIIDPIERPQEVFAEEVATDDNIVLNLTDGVMQQITTAPIAGFRVASTSRSASTLRYIERGTGYIFEVNLNSGLQSQVTPSTVTNAVEAYFSPDLTRVVVVTEQAGGRQVILLELPTSDSAGALRTTLVSDAENIQFINSSTLTYTRNTFINTTGYTYDLTTKSAAERFTLDIPDATVITTLTGDVFAYPKPTALFEGALYEVTGGGLTPSGQPALGLTAFVDADVSIVNQITNTSEYASFKLPNYVRQAVVLLPEKCVISNTPDTVWCAAPANPSDASFIESWYKGLVNSNDSLWEVNTLTTEARKIADPLNDTGRLVDATHMSVDPVYEQLLFINKIDSTLWLLNL